MEFVVIVVLILMLVTVAYVQWQRGVVRTMGELTADDEEADRSAR